MKKTVFIGSVLSSKIALETLIEENISINLVCSLEKGAAKNVSDYYPIHEIAQKNDVPFIEFKKINSLEVINKIKKIDPDFIFVIGLSQIISEEILNLAKEYCIGFHPTPLPVHRGRAALPWQILLGIKESKVSLFKLDEDTDSGDIIYQYPYQINETDYAIDVYKNVCNALKNALNACINKIYNDTVEFIKQNNDEATYLLVRRPEDGCINWNLSGNKILKLIRATSRPYPGAFSYYKGKRVIFWKAYLKENRKYTGINGQIACKNINGEITIITKDCLLIVTEYEIEDNNISLLVGHKFKSKVV